MKVTPYGLNECCICDGPAVLALRADSDSELLGYCREDAADHKAAFPDTQVFTLAEIDA